ncbi:carbonic anhydrase [Pararobbsia alpina]
MLNSIKPAVQATDYKGERSSKNAEFVDAVAQTNVRLTMDNIRNNSPTLADLEKKGQIKIVGSMYELQTGKLNFIG